MTRCRFGKCRNIIQSYIELKKPDEALAFMNRFQKNFLSPRLDESYMYAPLSYLLSISS